MTSLDIVLYCKIAEIVILSVWLLFLLGFLIYILCEPRR